MLRDSKDKSFIGRYSSFASVEKYLQEVVGTLMKNERLKRLLYYTDSKALSLPKLTQNQAFSLIGHQIKVVPQLNLEPDAKPYVIISLDNFTPQDDQTTFRSIQLTFDIVARFEDWSLEDFQLRPYSIAGEIDAMINHSYYFDGIANFMGAKQLILNDYMGGITLYYQVEVYGDDKKLHPDNA